MNRTQRLLNPMLLALSLAVAAPLAAHAVPGPDGDAGSGHSGFQHKRGGSHERGDFTRHLNLSDAQQDKIFELRHAAVPEFRAKGKELRQLKQALRQVAMSDSFDENRAIALSNQAARAEAEMTVMRLRLNNQMYQILTPEQRAQAQQAGKHRFERSRGKPQRVEPTPKTL